MAKRKIYLGPIDKAERSGLLVEGVADAAITPGKLVKRTATGLDVTDTNATEFGKQEKLVAIEYGSHAGKEIDDDYAIGELALAVNLKPGEFANVRVANAQTLIKGSPLSSNGDGTLKLATIPATVGATSEEVLFYSEEALTTSGVTLVKVRTA